MAKRRTHRRRRSSALADCACSGAVGGLGAAIKVPRRLAGKRGLLTSGAHIDTGHRARLHLPGDRDGGLVKLALTLGGAAAAWWAYRKFVAKK